MLLILVFYGLKMTARKFKAYKQLCLKEKKMSCSNFLKLIVVEQLQKNFNLLKLVLATSTSNNMSIYNGLKMMKIFLEVVKFLKLIIVK